MLNFVLCDSSSSFLNSLEKALNKLIVKDNFCANIAYKSTEVSDVYNQTQRDEDIFSNIQTS